MRSRRREQEAPRRRGRRIAVLATTTLVAWIAVDVGLAHLLFGERWVPEWARSLRAPALWASDKDELYHRLQSEWGHGVKDRMWQTVGHPEFGWIAGAANPETLRHKDDAPLDERRPILLFGDSYARGVGRRETRFQGLLERSELASDFVLLNYGTGGYGTDQTLLLMQAVVPLYVERDPIVVFSFLLDDDLDRSLMGFKSGVRPQLGVTASGELTNVGGPCTSRAEYFEAVPTPRFGYSWRLVARSSLWPAPVGELLSGEGQRVERAQTLNRRIFETVRDELAELAVDGFVLVFHGSPSARSPELWKPHEPFVIEALNELELPFVSTRRDLWRTAGGDVKQVADLFIPNGQPGAAHYTPLGNAAAFETLRRGLEGRFQEVPYEWPEPDDGFEPRAQPFLPAFADATITHPDPATARLRQDEDRDLWRIAPGRRGPTEFVWELDGAAWTIDLTASLMSRTGPRGELTGPVRLELEADGETLLTESIALGDEPKELGALLRGRDRLVLRIGRTGEGTPGWLVLRKPKFR